MTARILVVDDILSNVKLLEAKLGAEYFEVITAFSGEQALAKAVFGDTQFDWPREGTLSLKADKATLAGIDAKRVDVNVRIDANGLGVERLTIADFGGATLAVKGRIDTQSNAPRGAMTVDLDARSIDGIAVLAEKKVLVTGTMADMLKVDHPWVREYFHGPRARAALAAT